MRPTGKLHLGHWTGALENWVALQNEGGYSNYHLIADYHVLTTNLDSSQIYEYSIDMILDWLAAGIDPEAQSNFQAVADKRTPGASFDFFNVDYPAEA